MWCGAVGVGTGCRSGEVRKLQLKDICLLEGKILVIREIAKSRKEREPRLMALAEWGLRELLARAQSLGATKPEHYLLPLNLAKSRYRAKSAEADWDVNRPMTSWVKSWRKLMEACGMNGFRFHDLRHSAASYLAMNGASLAEIAEILGHKTLAMVKRYSHLSEAHTRNVVQRMNMAIFGQ